MKIWQVDFYRRPLQDDRGEPIWELVVYDLPMGQLYTAFCPQSAATADWLTAQLGQMADQLPERLQIFRPQCFSLLEVACNPLGITVEATRRTPELKQILQERVQVYAQLPGYTRQSYNPIAIEQPPPLPLPESLQGERWQFATLTAADLEETLLEKPFPILSTPPDLRPTALQLPRTIPIPGVVIYGGRRSLKLARWLEEQNPVSLHFTQAETSGLVLNAGLCDRWILVTFADPEVVGAATAFEQRKTPSAGLHFLLVQPDDSGITFTGLWLLQPVE